MIFRLLALILAFFSLTGCVSTNLETRQLTKIFVEMPKYPMELKVAGIKGEVIVEFVVGADDSIKGAFVVQSTHVGFEAAALEAVYRSKFHHAMKDGQPVDSRVRQMYFFDPEDQSQTPPAKKGSK